MVIRYFQHVWREMSATGRRTFPWDLVRGFSEGAFISVQWTFALVVAIQHFDASVIQKSIIAAMFPLGLMLSLAYASWSPVLGRNTVRAALPALGIALGLVVAAMARTAGLYTFGVTLSGICSRISIPVLTGIYRYNYRGRVRGQAYGIVAVAIAGSTLLFNSLGGVLLELAIENYRPFFLALAVLALAGGVSVLRMPGRREPGETVPNPLKCFSAVRDNPLFGYVLAAWFLFGFANLTMFPQRIEYLSQKEYGFSLSPGAIALILGVLFEAVRIPLIQIWARLFDRFNFIKIRIVLNLFMMGYVVIFFNSKSLWGVGLATCLLATALAGGAVAWNLWVTKFAPPEQTARYMAVHTFLTGIRGTIGPYLGYLCIEQLGIQASSWIAGAMVAASAAMLWPIRKMATRPDLVEKTVEIEGA